MAFAPIEQFGAGIDFATAYTAQTNVPIPIQTGMLVRGYDPALGVGEFVFAQAGGAINANDVCEYAPALASGLVTVKAIQWAGTQGAAKNLCVALVTLTSGQYGWFQVQGNAVCNTNGTIAVGDKTGWQAAGVLTSTIAAGKQVLGAQAVTANSATVTGYTLTNKAIFHIQRPISQGQIL